MKAMMTAAVLSFLVSGVAMAQGSAPATAPVKTEATATTAAPVKAEASKDAPVVAKKGRHAKKK